jgi:hypothetical protein
MKTLAAIALAFSMSANAGYLTGNKLDTLIKGSPAESVLASGYILGVFDAYHNIGHCAPGSVTITQVVDMTKIMLKDAAIRNQPADVLILMMLDKYWPCPAKSV